MGMIAWIVLVLKYQIGNRATIGLLFMLVLFKSITEGAYVFLSYIYVKVFIAPIIIAAILVFPQ